MAAAAPVASTPPPRGRANLPLLAVLAAALGLRLCNLDFNGPFIDESFHAIAGLYGNARFLTGDVHLYPQISHWVHEFAGLIGARALSAVFGTLTVACVYGLAKVTATRLVRAGECRAVGLFAALVMALSAPALFISQFANYYALSVLLFALGLWLSLRGVERDDSISLALGAVALVASFATRFLLLGYLPVALLAVWAQASGRATRSTNLRVFWIVFAVAFGGYVGFHHAHILAAIGHAQQSGTSLDRVPSLRLRGLIVIEGVSRMLPAALLAGVGLAFHAVRVARAAAPARRAALWTLAWLAIGFVWMTLYHVTFAHDLTMESNLAVSMVFGAVLAGLGAEALAAAMRGRIRRGVAIGLGVVAIAAATVHAVSIVAEDQTWPDWRPVVAAARERGVDRADSVWSTAHNGGMHSRWGVRGFASSMSGNVWQLRAALGPQVDIGSPWRYEPVPELLRQAAIQGVDFVIGPMPVSSLRIGARIRNFVVTDVVEVPNGPPCYILENTRRG